MKNFPFASPLPRFSFWSAMHRPLPSPRHGPAAEARVFWYHLKEQGWNPERKGVVLGGSVVSLRFQVTQITKTTSQVVVYIYMYIYIFVG